MNDIQLLHVTELLQQLGNQTAKTARDDYGAFLIHLSDGRLIRITPVGDKLWFLNNKLHRTDGPAIEYANGDKFWYLNNKLHRTDGPALEYSDARRGGSWYLNGVRQAEPSND